MEEKHLKSEICHSKALIVTTAVLVIAAALLTLLLPGSDLLYRENRKAASKPFFSTASLYDGSYGEALSSYIDDKLVLRQFWIDAKCFLDEMVLMKTEENGILIGKEARLFAKHFQGSAEETLLERNIDVIADYASESDIPVTVMIAPSAGTINPEMLPSFAPQTSEQEKLSEIYDRLSAVCSVVDVYPALREHNDEYLYYRSDHHWTTLGAYYAYLELAKCLGRDALSYDWKNAVETNGFLGTHYAKSRYVKALPDTILFFPSDTEISIKKVVGDAEFLEERQTPVINLEKLAGYDKYAAFLDGNNGYSVISGKGNGRILVVKDSFANCLIPLMADNFAQIGVVDYRNYSYGLSNLAEKEQYDEILILYSYATLETDNRLVYMNRPKA